MQDHSRVKCDRPVARVDRRTIVVRVRSVTRRTGEDTAEGGAARRSWERKRGTQTGAGTKRIRLRSQGGGANG